MPVNRNKAVRRNGPASASRPARAAHALDRLRQLPAHPLATRHIMPRHVMQPVITAGPGGAARHECDANPRPGWRAATLPWRPQPVTRELAPVPIPARPATERCVCGQCRRSVGGLSVRAARQPAWESAALRTVRCPSVPARHARLILRSGLSRLRHGLRSAEVERRPHPGVCCNNDEERGGTHAITPSLPPWPPQCGCVRLVARFSSSAGWWPVFPTYTAFFVSGRTRLRACVRRGYAAVWRTGLAP